MLYSRLICVLHVYRPIKIYDDESVTAMVNGKWHFGTLVGKQIGDQNLT